MGIPSRNQLFKVCMSVVNRIKFIDRQWHINIETVGYT